MAATGDPAFGLKVASHIKPTSFHALSYAISASSTLKEAFERAQRYSHIGSDAVDYEFWLSRFRVSLHHRAVRGSRR